jgi:hypothetical protein
MSRAPSRSAADARDARPLHARAERATSRFRGGVSRSARPARRSMRLRANISGRRASISITAPATASAAYLSVHEGPQRISKLGHVALEPGMILSNEPGYYKAGEYGIRIENLDRRCATHDRWCRARDAWLRRADPGADRPQPRPAKPDDALKKRHGSTPITKRCGQSFRRFYRRVCAVG